MKRIKISFGFCAMICFLAWLDLWLCGRFLLCALVHELGHLAAMTVCRQKVQGVHIGIGGAVICGQFTSYGAECLCAAAGPLTGLLFGVAVLYPAPKTAMVSILLSVINLLPIFPLDGGRVLRCALLLRLPQERAMQISKTVCVTMACVLMLLASWGTVCLQMGLWPIFAALVLLWRAGEE